MARRDVDLLYEVGTMRHIDRSWVQFGRPNVENLAEHTLRVAWIAQVLAARAGADVGRTAQLAMIHDLGELRAGDIHWLNRAYVQRDETRAVAATVRQTALEPRVLELWQELEDKETLEAQIVKDADNLDIDLEFRERSHDWPFAGTQSLVRRAVYERNLRTSVAKELWREIQESDPQHWYVEVYDELRGMGRPKGAE